MTPALMLSIIGTVISLIGLAVAILSVRNNAKALEATLEKHQRESSRELDNTILRTCREFTNSDEYSNRKDRRIRELAREEIDEAFRARAESFVDAKVFDEFRRNLDKQLSDLTGAVNANTRAVSEASGKISADIAVQVSAFLNARFPSGGMVQQSTPFNGDGTGGK
jgi:uncharacterized membrane protein YccC